MCDSQTALNDRNVKLQFVLAFPCPVGCGLVGFLCCGVWRTGGVTIIVWSVPVMRGVIIGVWSVPVIRGVTNV